MDLKAATPQQMEDLFNEAFKAGFKAGEEYTPTPVIFGSPSTPFGSDVDLSKPHSYEAEGVCGFAWVNVKPGNSRFARWLKKEGHARTDSYYGGVTIWIRDHNQSYERKYAHAQVLAKILEEAGVKAYANGRLD